MTVEDLLDDVVEDLAEQLDLGYTEQAALRERLEQLAEDIQLIDIDDDDF